MPLPKLPTPRLVAPAHRRFAKYQWMQHQKMRVGPKKRRVGKRQSRQWKAFDKSWSWMKSDKGLQDACFSVPAVYRHWEFSMFRIARYKRASILRTLNTLILRNILPQQRHYRLALLRITGLCSQRGVREVWDLMERSGVIPSGAVLAAYLKACARFRQDAWAVQAWNAYCTELSWNTKAIPPPKHEPLLPGLPVPNTPQTVVYKNLKELTDQPFWAKLPDLHPNSLSDQGNRYNYTREVYLQMINVMLRVGNMDMAYKLLDELDHQLLSDPHTAPAVEPPVPLHRHPIRRQVGKWSYWKKRGGKTKGWKRGLHWRKHYKRDGRIYQNVVDFNRWFKKKALRENRKTLREVRKYGLKKPWRENKPFRKAVPPNPNRYNVSRTKTHKGVTNAHFLLSAYTSMVRYAPSFSYAKALYQRFMKLLDENPSVAHEIAIGQVWSYTAPRLKLQDEIEAWPKHPTNPGRVPKILEHPILKEYWLGKKRIRTARLRARLLTWRPQLKAKLRVANVSTIVGALVMNGADNMQQANDLTDWVMQQHENWDRWDSVFLLDSRLLEDLFVSYLSQLGYPIRVTGKSTRMGYYRRALPKKRRLNRQENMRDGARTIAEDATKLMDKILSTIPHRRIHPKVHDYYMLILATVSPPGSLLAHKHWHKHVLGKKWMSSIQAACMFIEYLTIAKKTKRTEHVYELHGRMKHAGLFKYERKGAAAVARYMDKFKEETGVPTLTQKQHIAHEARKRAREMLEKQQKSGGNETLLPTWTVPDVTKRHRYSPVVGGRLKEIYQNTVANQPNLPLFRRGGGTL
eukprot:TRINITY_DN94666_c0_g1_i1.p1 TRINITY_DN94666_c0_g1~~TRINITY_DN94666_c0_g1_i1.p1  ORF type:complete len:802 (-),score=45.19 TRINITY_DN94666_c0_g1_i1:283-2688(-)